MTTADIPFAERFGRRVRPAWRLDPGLVHLDHGAFGAALGVALDAQAGWRRVLESDPAGFMTETMAGAVAEARAALARFLGCEAEALALVGNVTDGLNAVLRSHRLAPGATVVTTALAHGGLRQALKHICEAGGARLVTVPLPAPLAGPDAVIEAVEAALAPGTALAVLEHVTSPGGVVLPIARLCALCRARGVPVLVDGAHGPGMLALDVPALGADWYVGSGHKWLSAPKGVAFLWAAAGRREGLRPAVAAAERDAGFPAAFDWTGTRDASAWLALPATLDFWREIGIDAARAYMAGLAAHAGAVLAERWRTETLAPAEMTAAMVAVRAPVAGTDQRALRARLRAEHGLVVTVNALSGALWVRASLAAYTEADDVARLAASM